MLNGLLAVVLALVAPTETPLVLEGDRVTVRYAPGLEDRAADVRDRLPWRLRQVEKALGGKLSRPVTVRLVGEDGFRRIVGPRAKQIAAVAFPADATLVIKTTSDRPELGVPLPAIVRHELAHLVLRDLCRGHRLPLWFEEGLADLVGGAYPVAAMEDLPAAVTSGRIRDLDDLAESFPDEPSEFSLAYLQSENFLAFLERDIGRAGLQAVLRRVSIDGDLDGAIYHVSGQKRRELERRWREDLERRHPLWEVLLRTRWIEFLLFVCGLLALAAAARYLWRRRAILRELDEEEPPTIPGPGCESPRRSEP